MDRVERFDFIRIRKGFLFFFDLNESSYDYFILGYVGIVFLVVVGFVIVNLDKKVIVVVGDVFILNGYLLEVLNYIGYKKLENILIIVNDNEMFIGENVGFILKFLKKVILSGKY